MAIQRRASAACWVSGFSPWSSCSVSGFCTIRATSEVKQWRFLCLFLQKSGQLRYLCRLRSASWGDGDRQADVEAGALAHHQLDDENLEPAKGIEPPTSCLQNSLKARSEP